MIYTVKVGDSLTSISEKFLGDKARYKEILAINPSIKDANKIYPNQKINIPDSPYPSKQVQPILPEISKSSNESGIVLRLKTLLMDKRVVLGLLSLAGLYFIYKKKKK